MCTLFFFFFPLNQWSPKVPGPIILFIKMCQGLFFGCEANWHSTHHIHTAEPNQCVSLYTYHLPGMVQGS